MNDPAFALRGFGGQAKSGTKCRDWGVRESLGNGIFVVSFVASFVGKDHGKDRDNDGFDQVVRGRRGQSVVWKSFLHSNVGFEHSRWRWL